MLPDAERQRILNDWNATATDWGGIATAQELVAAQAATT